jgi:ABC-type multidrug transport system fused ATPase/permease subunit
LRRVIDPKIYLKVYTNIAVHIAESCRSNGQTNSKAAARTELSREYIFFLRSRVPDFIEGVFDLGGAIIALAFYDPRISLTCLGATIPMIFVYHLYNSRVVRLQKEFHDRREDVFSIYQEKGIQDIREYHEKMVLPQMSIAKWGAFNFGLLRVVLLGIFLAVLYLAIAVDRLSPGEIYSVVAYIWTFITATEFLPDLLESFTSLKDIQNRIRAETPPGDRPSTA